ncbi:Dyp-type peroxidase [Streptomyces sp. NBC_00989]|uniref:Dyp-type peroxidase n=1 Tax=Streptomyces sp. NBC_00989 TaxID=2903705 RepID=UPI0038697C88|nr:Dyp-type peroxidase [Streptomyces sp. NBC_00989]
MTAHLFHDTPGDSPEPSRRRFLLETAGLGVLGAAAACAPERRPAAPGGTGFTFRGARQAGVTTPQQPAVLVVSYDLAPDLYGRAGRRAVRDVLARWSRALDAEPAPARLTATVGIGPLLPGRLGVSAPDALREVPPFPGDRLDPARCGGHVLVQLCADDRRTTEQAATTLTGLAAEALRPRWRQTGFLSPTPAGQTPRNLLGFKDGTENPTPQEREKWVWAGDSTFLVVRRVHIRVGDFSRLAPRRQEEIIGRHRADGAPLGRRHEHDDVDIFAKSPQGRYVIPLHAHVRAASPRFDGGARMLRRGYSYDEGPDDRGLLFLAFMRDPALFVRVQQRLAERDDLSRFIEHRASAVAYVLPGARAGEDLGARLLG